MTSERSSNESDEYLVVQLRVEPHAGVDCSLLASGPRGRDVRQNVVVPDRNGDSEPECRAEVTLGAAAERRYLEGPVTDRCVCPVFEEHDCVSSIEAFDGEDLVVSLSVPDREVLRSIISRLRDIDANPRLQRITSGGSGESGVGLRLDLRSITDKQREAVEAAIEEGYYETPRRATLEDLAERLGVSRSAVSQRLRAVETHLVSQFASAGGGDCSPR